MRKGVWKMSTEKEKMIQGEMYDPSDELLMKERTNARDVIHQFNHSVSREERTALLKSLFGKTGNSIHIEPTLRVDYGYNIHVGENFFANFNTVILDVCPVRFGDNAMLGNGVSIVTPEHPLDAKGRNSGYEFGRPITIGDNCWIGTGATIVGGVVLGNNVVVAAGAVVTKSFPDNVLLAGVPARVVKEIDQNPE